MKSYHLSKEQVFEIAMQISTNLIIRNDQEDLQEFANAVLDQVLGEPVGIISQYKESICYVELPEGTKLYAPKEQS